MNSFIYLKNITIAQKFSNDSSCGTVMKRILLFFGFFAEQADFYL